MGLEKSSLSTLTQCVLFYDSYSGSNTESFLKIYCRFLKVNSMDLITMKSAVVTQRLTDIKIASYFFNNMIEFSSQTVKEI